MTFFTSSSVGDGGSVYVASPAAGVALSSGEVDILLFTVCELFLGFIVYFFIIIRFNQNDFTVFLYYLEG